MKEKVFDASKMRELRKERGLTQSKLAKLSGLSLSAIQGYEQGRYEPKRKSLESIAEVFKIPVDELYDMPTQLSTNLASLGTDCISRQQAINALSTITLYKGSIPFNTAVMRIKQLPPIQPELQYKTDYGFMWLCPKCGLPVHSDYTKCVRCGHNREKGV